MKLGVFGTGYVGLVTGICFAEKGNSVLCADIDRNKITLLNQGVPPIYEPGLKELLDTNKKAGRIQFTNDIINTIANSDILFIAVGTPSGEDGSADLTWVYNVADTIGKNMSSRKILVVKSTVPVGTNEKVKAIVQKNLQERNLDITFDIVSNPEFLREGNAIEDCLRPDRVILGCENKNAADVMMRVYRPFLTEESQVIIMDLASAELTKYAANALLATKISFMNELSRLCEKTGANIDFIKKGIGSDHRIGPYFINAGIGYGGSCFPKDVKALVFSAHQNGIDTPILESVEKINHQQRRNFIDLILANLPKKSKLALWGIAFKPGTDDIREAPAIDIITALIEHGHSVLAYDPVAATNAKAFFAAKSQDFIKNIEFIDDQYEVLKGVDALVIATEWESFRDPDFELITKALKLKVIFDGRNIYRLEDISAQKLTYFSIGRPLVKTNLS